MRNLFTLLLDFVFPPSADAEAVARATEREVLAHYAPLRHDDRISLASYHHPLVRALVHEAKYHANEHAFTLLGLLLGHHLSRTYKHPLVLIPVPLSEPRLRERGYNQVERIAEYGRLQRPTITIRTDILKKVRHTHPQTKLRRSERLANLRNAFTAQMPANLSADTHLVLLDDITTTGTTLAETAQALAQAGFTHTTQLAIARA